MKPLLNLCVAAAALAIAACQGMPPGTTVSPAVKLMDVNGVSLAYTEQGRGNPVVMVHGCCADSRAWDRHREAIAQSHRFIALDQRYWGTAPWPDKGEKYSPETQIEDLGAFLRGLRLELDACLKFLRDDSRREGDEHASCATEPSPTRSIRTQQSPRGADRCGADDADATGEHAPDGDDLKHPGDRDGDGQ